MKHRVNVGVRWKLKLVSYGPHFLCYLKWSKESLGQLRMRISYYKYLTTWLELNKHLVTHLKFNILPFIICKVLHCLLSFEKLLS